MPRDIGILPIVLFSGKTERKFPAERFHGRTSLRASRPWRGLQ